MKIAKNTVVSLHYTLKNKEGNVLDTSRGGDPLVYLHGVGNLIPGLEKQLEGLEMGEALQAIVPPEEAYGLRSEEFIKVVPRASFQGTEELSVGMQVQVQSQSGQYANAVISKVEGDSVSLDLNHPLAGETLFFDVNVEAIREASNEEIEHKHVHGPGGHHH